MAHTFVVIVSFITQILDSEHLHLEKNASLILLRPYFFVNTNPLSALVQLSLFFHILKSLNKSWSLLL